MVEFHRRQYAAEAGDDTPRRIGKHDPEYSRRKQYAPEYQRKAARLLRRAASFCAPAGAGPVRYLEVGCASGGMLKAARDRGFAATGVEISAEAAAYGLNHERLDIRIGRMEEHRFADSAFDLVMVYDVLEHVSSPAALLTECARVLAPGGALCVHTACGERSWTARLAGHRYFLADPSGGHIVLFSPGTLRRYVERAGLEVAGVSTHGFRWIQTEAERARHGLCRRLARPLENAAHELARLFGGGHFVFLFARKPTRIRADRGSL
jgi:SAM-dependent methyltransferase